MRRIDVNGCSVDILPVIKGLVSECDKAAYALANDYDVVGIALGPEDITAFENRERIMEEDGFDLSDLELVYSHFLMNFGTVDFPTPAYSLLIDTCKERSIPLAPLDMDDELYSEVYCDTVSALELLKETKFAKKALKKKFDMSSPEAFVLDWDDNINRIRGFRTLSEEREAFMADSIRKTSCGKGSMLAVIELERADGVMEDLIGDA